MAHLMIEGACGDASLLGGRAAREALFPLKRTGDSALIHRRAGISAGANRLLMSVRDDRWPGWARPQLQDAIALAVDLAATTAPGRTLATELYDRWFAGTVAADRPPAAARRAVPTRARRRRDRARRRRTRPRSAGQDRLGRLVADVEHLMAPAARAPARAAVAIGVDRCRPRRDADCALRDIPYVLAMPGDPAGSPAAEPPCCTCPGSPRSRRSWWTSSRGCCAPTPRRCACRSRRRRDRRSTRTTG